MDIAIPSLAAQPPSERCKICRRAAPRGSKLCAQCKAAVRRARQVPTVVSELLPATTGTAFPPTRNPPRRATTAPAARRMALPPFSRRWATYLAFAAFAVAVCVTGYFAFDEIDNRSGGEPNAPVATATREGEVTVSAVVSVPPAVSDESAGAPIDPAPEQTLPPPHEYDVARQVVGTATAPIASRASPARPLAYPPSRRQAATPETVPERLTPPARVASAGSDSATTPAGDTYGPPQVVRPAEPPEARAPDRLQMLRVAVARCAKENFLAGFVCDQQARLRYCEGHWGEVPECPGGIRADSGR